MRHDLKLCFAATCLATLVASAPVHAAPIAPTFDTFGTLAGATFGGSGIPNDAVAITTFNLGDGSLTFGLTAHERFLNPAVGNNGAGTFSATPGVNFGDPTNATTPSSTLGATWNFAYYISVSGFATIGDMLDQHGGDIHLLYDFNPGAGTDETQLGDIDLIALLGNALFNGDTLQDSQNLLFGFLSSNATTGITPPPGAFDPNAGGEYTFALRYIDDAGSNLAQAAINVDLPEPGTLAVIGLGLAGLGLLRRRKRG
jgi:hypothetical protein